MKTISKKLLFLLLLLPLSVLAQSTVSGVVSDKASGQPLPGVNVIIKGTSKGTTTDFDGKYELSNVTNGEVIEFSYVGFTTQDIPYASQKTINVSLEEETAKLDEVVLVGYGTVKKKDVTGAVTQISTKDFNKGANVTAENLLNGRVAGLTINTSGAPGSGSQIRIRGGSSLSASNDPLIVIDGLPITNDTNTGSTSFLASLNPNDIESFTVLKDASATAIYGSRASNGVIIITTKRGGKKLSVDYNFQYGSGRLTDKVDVFSADEYRAYIQERETMLNTDSDPNNNVNLVSQLGDSNTDWQDEIYRRTDFVDHSLSLKGNLFNAIPTRFSIGNSYQQGLRLTNDFTRNTASLAMTPTLFKDHLKLKVAVNYANERNRFADGVEGSAIVFDPTQPVYDSESPFDGFFEYRNGPSTANFTPNVVRNPVAQLMQTNSKGINNRIFGNFELDYKFHFFPDMRAVVNVGYDYADGESRRLVSRNALTGFINGTELFGTNEYSESTRRNSLFDGYLIYNKSFNNFNIDAQVGYSYQKFEAEFFNTFNVNNPQSQPPRSSVDTDLVLIGLFGRTFINFKDKYLLTLTYRRDASSRFPEDIRWGNFPAAAFAWKMKDDFFKDSKVLSDLKLRLGWGVTGQQDIGGARDFYIERYNTGDPNSQYVFGVVPFPVGVPQPRNPILKWEETTTYNVGFDYGLFDNRVSGSLEFFYKQSDDLLSFAPFADGGNFSNAGFQNIGSFTTKGVEFSINADIVKSENFNWNVNFNATKFERRIDELALGADILLGGTGAGTGGTVQIHSEGFTPFSYYVYNQLYDTDGTPIEGAFADLNGDGIINGDDRYIYKNPDPDLLLGFASSMNYKNFDFSFNLRASIGNRVYNAVNSTRAYNSLLLNNGVIGNIPQSVTETDFETINGENVISDIFIENASFLRMDNITLGYTFTKFLEGKASLRLFTGCQNAFVLTEYSGLDPEITNDGRDNTIYPRQRQFLFGANIKF